MRAFGILAAFAAISTVLAAPFPAPPSRNGLAVRHDDLVSADRAVSVPSVEVDAEVEVTRRHDNAVAVNACVAGVVVSLKVDVDALITQIKAILDDTTSDVTTIVAKVLPLLNKLVSDITTATAKAGLNAVGNVFGIVGSVPSTVNNVAGTATSTVNGVVGAATSTANGVVNVANLTIQDVAGILKVIETDIVDILTKVATLIGNTDPAAAAVIQTVIAVLNLLTTTLGGLVGDLTPLLTPITDLVGPILAALGINLAGAN
ncbi:SubName: Full=Uncharacterized protein {ECO:0000313/EMBL:CCA73471.1} [Serendipita indica DSM 11827]|uniref:Uncharacterized protein n=1 Tax=Serendipita indica (strain DSM 11827) TaxID=1109443 RepID=G4TQ78_SERID|nr:SubName: Full=Uncharacterized protein {ECO:0000313/EMBL:CCA73471.1} [Serendipita indica DSM 11827]CCA73471.1 hypothetical protein PIIN_07425 [Serendipita indica DSM 11827]